MNIDQRDEEIWRLRKEGATYSQIASRFDISPTRVEQICRKRKEKIENFAKWPPLRRDLSVRIRNVLVKTFGNEEIFNHPEKLASLGGEVFLTWRNIGRKSVKELIDLLEKLGYAVNRNVRMTEMRCQSYLQIGRTILRSYFDYYTKKSLDDTEYIPVVRLIIEGMAKEMRSSGMLGPNCHEVVDKLKAFNRSLYQNIWIEHAKEDEEWGEEPADLEKEYESAKYTFDYIYEHGEHPE